jgi:hypothetical protein
MKISESNKHGKKVLQSTAMAEKGFFRNSAFIEAVFSLLLSVAATPD